MNSLANAARRTGEWWVAKSLCIMTDLAVGEDPAMRVISWWEFLLRCVSEGSLKWEGR